ncbi:hypothetical protein KQX54_001422 [Cotesia glomerata]|uniref:Uncharacterized protein n=1 Tax=Cotesia glomerata TaxID=32391 RepID=A0AAV7IBQ8_COTGL|nr:hypothetical protein KQX54_001422 [Cotesia glomerata]
MTRSIETSTRPPHGPPGAGIGLLGDTGADRVEVGLGFGSDMGSIDVTALVEASTDLKDVSDSASFEQFGHFWSSAP